MQNADNLEKCDPELIHSFSKPISPIHGVCSVLSLYAVFAVQNCLLGCAETKGRKIEIIHVWHSVSSVAPKRKPVQAVGRQCFQMIAVKIQYRQATGNWNFLNLIIGLEVYLNFFPCVYFQIFYYRKLMLVDLLCLSYNLHKLTLFSNF